MSVGVEFAFGHHSMDNSPVLAHLAHREFDAAIACLAHDAEAQNAVVDYPSLAIACSAVGVESDESDAGDGDERAWGGEPPAPHPIKGLPLSKVLRTLLQHGARIDATDTRGRSATLICVLLGESTALTVLLEASPPPDLLLRTSETQMSPLGASFAQVASMPHAACVL